MLRKLEVPLVPVVPGNHMEVSLRRAMTISDGDWTIPLASPLSIALRLIAITGFVLPIFPSAIVRRRMKAAQSDRDLVEMDRGD
ncbi:hypothetical protein [Paracoccus sp. (in: a-proteobacteria)]|uniref:hypothetical protein n=1 Tax=Paracoccus sp. TaxID=267 RepID=UPI003A8B2D30